MNFFLVSLTALSLSMDAFSLALSYGTLGFNKKKRIILALTVGIFHFFMPLLGHVLGTRFISYFHLDISFISGIIFSYIAIGMLKEYKRNTTTEVKLDIAGILLFSLGVSLDSFGIGFVLNYSLINIIQCGIIFSIFSFSFTLLGLFLGKKLSSIIGDYAIILGSIIMILLATINFVNFCNFD